jgi:hypothetical protein
MNEFEQALKTIFSRRVFLKGTIVCLSGLLFSGCDQSYIRPPGEHDLGTIAELLARETHLKGKAFLVLLDERGWSVLSTRCTKEGCGLSLQDNELICPCCRSVFSRAGEVLVGPAEKPLPWYEIRYVDGRLYANSGAPTDINHRFITPSLEATMKDVSRYLTEREANKLTKVPDILLGEPNDDVGKMFVENTPDEVFEAMLEKERKIAREEAKHSGKDN